jgi:hypothetical protein
MSQTHQGLKFLAKESFVRGLLSGDWLRGERGFIGGEGSLEKKLHLLAGLKPLRMKPHEDASFLGHLGLCALW